MISQIRIDRGRLCLLSQNIVPEISWVFSDKQVSFELKIGSFSSGKIESEDNSFKIPEGVLDYGTKYEGCVTVWDGKRKYTKVFSFRTPLKSWDSSWIAPDDEREDIVFRFRKEFNLEKIPSDAALFVCGIGLHRVTVNGEPLDKDIYLSPAVSSYDKRCYYDVFELAPFLREGGNTIDIRLAQGWRRNNGPYLRVVPIKRELFGIPQLTACLKLGEETIDTDGSWLCFETAVKSHLFDGESFDAGIKEETPVPVRVVPAPTEETVMCPRTLEQVKVMKKYRPVSVREGKKGYIFDLGQNIAGVCKISLPAGIPEGTEIIITYAEILDDEGELYTATLRSAKCTDRYISSGNKAVTWAPEFTYHGFRYVCVEGLPFTPDRDTIIGIAFYQDMDSGSYFRCGDALVNAIHEMVVMTERDNLHTIATDCPQRDERMGWMNDATVRFEEIGYNFDAGNLFPKIVRDICDCQRDGAITCTAPFVYGSRPADPVCSSFLVAAQQAYLHYGNRELIRECYDNFIAWNEYLASRCDDNIVDYTYYGDWASPQDCCIGDSPCSAVTPGVFMSTAYHFYNYVLLSKFAEILNRDGDAERFRTRAEEVRKSILAKWLGDNGVICTGSQACQAASLRLGIMPEEKKSDAAKRMFEAVESAGNRFTTGNLCTLYLLESLADYGYIDKAWELITKQDYPSYGFMIQHGGTTVWERFERKWDPGMNSYCHPMYGSVGKWFYSHIAGIIPTGEGFRTAIIRPHMPSKLFHAEATVATCRGDISVRWEKSYGTTKIIAAVPYGVKATLEYGDINERFGGGTHRFIIK
ncbi:MAG: family 78 glycoside hydrolase catalytic domain [Clostridiales bacterium]|nr:family 78 glycoside hydrolase catalytic domain [Clostridiales bacterium]